MGTIYLPVETETGKVDYSYVTYAITELPVEEWLTLVDGWEFKEFQIIRKEEV